MTQVAKRWVYGINANPPIREGIDQLDTRPLFELISNVTSITNSYKQQIISFDNMGRHAVSVFSGEQEHPFLVDQQYDYYPTGRVYHGYVRVENDAVNMSISATTVENAYVEASNRIGSLRDGYHRKVEHMGGTIRVGDIYDLNSLPTTLNVGMFPPKSTTPATPDRYFLRASDMGYVHYVKSSYSGSPTTNEALETKNVTGKKTWIWDDATMTRGAVLSTDLVDNEGVEVTDVETLVNAALAAIHSNLDDTWPADDQAWEVYHIPGRTKIKMSAAQTEITHFDTDYATIKKRFIMTKDGTVVVKSAANTITLGNADGDVVITDGTRTITMDGSTVDVS